MKFDEFKKTTNLTEAPMGALKTFGLTSLSKVSSTAAGKLQTGTMANQLYADFKNYLGQSGDQAEPEIVLQFLKSKGIPTKSAEAIMAQSAGDTKGAVDATAGRVDPTMDEPAATGAAQPAAGQSPEEVRKAKQATAAGAAQDQMAANPAPGPQGGDQANKGAGFNPDTGEPFASQADADAYKASPQAKQPSPGLEKPNFNNQTAGGQQTISTGGTFDPATMKNKPGTPVGAGIQGGVPSTQDPRSTIGQQAAPAAAAEPQAEPAPDGSAAPTQPAGNRPQGGGRVAGQQSQTPGAIAKREKRAGGGASSTSSALDQFVKTQMGSNPVTMNPAEPQQNPVPPKQKKKVKGAVGDAGWEKNASSFADSIEFEYDSLMEALSRGQLSKIFLAAAQDAARAGIGAGGAQGQQQAQGGAAPATGGQQAAPAAQGGQEKPAGFMAGLKAGFTGQDGEEGGDVTGTLNVNQLAGLLPGVDAKVLAQAVTAIKQGKELNRTQLAACGQAFVALVKADPATTTQVMGMLKKISVK